MREPGDALQRARRAVDGSEGVVSVGNWRWSDADKRWCLPLILRHGTLATRDIPSETSWLVAVDEHFPGGGVEIHPAATDSISATFWHQRFNGITNGRERRDGRICVARPSQALGRLGDGDEPFDPSARLNWNVSRALAWLRDAAAGTLIADGEPFELPDFPGAEEGAETVAFQEDGASFQLWASQAERSGIAEIRSSQRLHVVKAFRDMRGKTIREMEWGTLENLPTNTGFAAWIRLSSVPALPPWQAPASLGDLGRVLSDSGIDLNSMLATVAGRMPREFRDGRQHLLLVGFPVPGRIGQTPTQLHWQALRLPALSSNGSRGFRPKAPSLRLRDERVVLRTSAPLDWQCSENWSDASLACRGAFEPSLRTARIAVIGVGALGSAIAELLVRAGCNDLLLIDSELFRAGNGARHVLNLESLGLPKATELANRLNLVRPSARVEAIVASAPRMRDDKLKLLGESKLVIDTTGSDGFLASLGHIPWQGAPALASLSLGWKAQRLYCYFSPAPSFRYDDFRSALDPWITSERKLLGAGPELPREGFGCWHPVFPARADSVWLLASVATKWLENGWRRSDPSFKVFEQVLEADVFGGVREATLPPV